MFLLWYEGQRGRFRLCGGWRFVGVLLGPFHILVFYRKDRVLDVQGGPLGMFMEVTPGCHKIVEERVLAIKVRDEIVVI